MQAANDAACFLDAALTANKLHSVQQSGMTTADNDHQTAFRFNPQCLIVIEPILALPIRVQKKCFCGALYGMRKRERQTKALELLKLFDLEEAADRKFAGYSKGMKRKLTIAAGIIHNPRILFLDEPTTGIDVVSARQIRQLIADLNSHGTTIFLTTHYIEEAERLCRRIGFIVKGDLVRIDTVDNLMRQTSGRYAMQFTLAKKVGGLCDAVLDAFPQLNCQVTSRNAFIVDSAKPLSIGPLVRLLEDYGAEVYEARKVQPSLEDVFVSITGIAASAMQQDKEKHNAGGH